MTNAPPCATCGSALRWYPDHYGWGCDRCRQFHPSPRPAAPAVAAAPRAYQPIAHGSPRRSSLPILIGIGGLAVVAVGIALVLKVKGGRTGGAASRQEVIDDTFAALEAGDTDKLMDLGDGGVLFNRIMDCKGRDDDDDDRPRRKRDDDDDDELAEMRDPDKVLDRVQRETRRTAAMMKGVRFEVLDVLTREPPKLDDRRGADDDDDDLRDRGRAKYEPRRARDRDDDDDRDRDRDLDVTVMRKGKKVMKGCYAKQTFRMQRIKVRVRIQEDDREPDTQKVTLNALELDGRWYLSTPPEIKLHKSYARMLNVMRDEMCECTDGKCANKVERDWKRYGKYMLREAKDRLKKDELSELDPIEKELKECRKRAGGRADAGDDTLAKMVEVTDKMCACKDKACSERVQEEFTRWGADMAKKSDREETDADVQKKITDVMTRYSECMMKLYGSDTSGLDAAPYGMPSACSEHREVTARIMACSSVGTAQRTQFKDGWHTFARTWRDGDSSERVRIEMNCRSTVESLKQLQQALCN
ncbi:MAG: hypothetical protein KIT31_32240 [Deltaproteobacteria bacterium]|nr:hypothetical protein [Deltaproteobacteria bacterium]